MFRDHAPNFPSILTQVTKSFPSLGRLSGLPISSRLLGRFQGGPQREASGELENVCGKQSETEHLGLRVSVTVVEGSQRRRWTLDGERSSGHRRQLDLLLMVSIVTNCDWYMWCSTAMHGLGACPGYLRTMGTAIGHTTIDCNPHYAHRSRHSRSRPRVPHQPRTVPDHHRCPGRVLRRSTRMPYALEHRLELSVHAPIVHLGLRAPQHSRPR
jgi:hypothetical protein